MGHDRSRPHTCTQKSFPARPQTSSPESKAPEPGLRCSGSGPRCPPSCICTVPTLTSARLPPAPAASNATCEGFCCCAISDGSCPSSVLRGLSSLVPSIAWPHRFSLGQFTIERVHHMDATVSTFSQAHERELVCGEEGGGGRLPWLLRPGSHCIVPSVCNYDRSHGFV